MAKAKKKAALSLEERIEQALIPVDEQPYEVPENWCWVIFDNIVSIKRGASPRPIKAFVTEEGGVNWIKIGDSDSGKYINNVKEKITPEGASKSVYVDKGTLLLSNSMSFGRPYILNVDGCIHDGWLSITPSQIISKDFLYYALLASSWYFEQVAVGTAVRNLNLDRVASMPIAIPPLAEQQRIVEQIENLFAKLDEAKEKLEDTINGFQIRKVSILHNAFTGQLTKSWRENQGKSDTVYKKEELKNLTSVIGDGLHGTPCYDESGEYYFINGNNFAGKNIEIKADTKTVNTEEYEKHKKKLSAQNTVFVSINGTLGKTAFYNDEPIILGKSACYLNVLPELNKYYLRYYFETEEFTQYANEKATGSTIKNLGLKAMRELQINVPSIEEQEEIVRLLDKILYRENEAKEKAKEVLEQIDLIKKAILAKAFRGELGTNNPDEESAVELFKSILETE